MPVIVRTAEPEDWLTWERMRYALWPGDDEEHGNVTSNYFAGKTIDPQHVLMVESDGIAVGFVELTIRTDLPGLEDQRVGYIEGLYVAEPARHQGIARAMLAASRAWAVSQGCEAFASDRDDRVIVDRGFAAYALSRRV